MLELMRIHEAEMQRTARMEQEDPHAEELGRCRANMENARPEWGPKEDLEWGAFVGRWQSEFYNGRTLGTVASAYMRAGTIKEFAGVIGVSYSTAVRKLTPILEEMGFRRGLLDGLNGFKQQ